MAPKKPPKKGAPSGASTASPERQRELAAAMRRCALESLELARAATDRDEQERHYLRGHMEENIAKGYEESARKRSGGKAKAANQAEDVAAREQQVIAIADALIVAGKPARSVASIVAKRLGLSPSQVRRIRGKARTS
jgi:hypothetical protein